MLRAGWVGPGRVGWGGVQLGLYAPAGCCCCCWLPSVCAALHSLLPPLLLLARSSSSPPTQLLLPASSPVATPPAWDSVGALLPLLLNNWVLLQLLLLESAATAAAAPSAAAPVAPLGDRLLMMGAWSCTQLSACARLAVSSQRNLVDMCWISCRAGQGGRQAGSIALKQVQGVVHSPLSQIHPFLLTSTSDTLPLLTYLNNSLQHIHGMCPGPSYTWHVPRSRVTGAAG